MTQDKMINLYTIKEASEATGLDERQIMYKIRKGVVEGAQKIGWIWVIPEESVNALKSDKKEGTDE